jgi:hypothetical protein
MIDEAPIDRKKYRFVPKKQVNPFRVKINDDTLEFIRAWADSRKIPTGKALEEIIANPAVQALQPEHVMNWKEKYLDQKARGAYISCELTLGRKPVGGKVLDAILPPE